MSTTVTINLNNTEQILKARNLETGGKAQQFFTSEVKRLSDGYTPMDTGTLKSNATLTADSITYNSPYARRMWEGKVMAGNPLEATDKDIKFQGSPMRGMKWTLRMYADRGKEIEKSVADFVGGKVE